MNALTHQIRIHAGRRLQMLGYVTGVMDALSKAARQHGAIILMYHSVADGDVGRYVDQRNRVSADVFESQMAFLATRRTVIALSDLLATLGSGKDPPDGAVVITFDDGYLDTLTTAAPVLQQYGFPATLFLPTGYIDRAEPQWADQVYSTFRFRRWDRLVWRASSAGQQFDLGDRRGREAAYRFVCADLLTASAEVRRDLLAQMRDQLRPDCNLPRLTMSWNDVRRLVREYPGFSIGGHTVEHLDLTNMSLDRAGREISTCRDHLDDRLGHAPRCFSFPYGRSLPELRRLVEQSGFRSSCGGGHGAVVTTGSDRFALPRVEAPPSMRRFDLLTNPANAGIWRRLGR